VEDPVGLVVADGICVVRGSSYVVRELVQIIVVLRDYLQVDYLPKNNPTAQLD